MAARRGGWPDWLPSNVRHRVALLRLWVSLLSTLPEVQATVVQVQAACTALGMPILPFRDLAGKQDGTLAEQSEEPEEPIKDTPPSEKQIAILERNGIRWKGLTRAQVSAHIDEVIRRSRLRLCTLKQAKILEKFGYDPECSFEQARVWIDLLAANDWERPSYTPALPVKIVSVPSTPALPGTVAPAKQGPEKILIEI